MMVQVSPFTFVEADTVVEVSWDYPRNPDGPKVWVIQGDSRRSTTAKNYSVPPESGEEAYMQEMSALVLEINAAKSR